MRYATASLLLCCFFAACTDTQDLGDRPGENDGGAKDASTSTDAAADTANLPDSTAADSGEDAGNEAGVWSPKQLAGLELWLDSSNGVVADLAKPGFATKWLDQSGKGHDATAIPSNNTLPKIQAAGLAAKNTVRCEAQPYFEITDAPGLHLGMGDWGIVMVAKFTYDSGQGGPVLFMKNGGLRIDVNGSGNVVLAAGSGTAAVANVPPSTFHIMSMRGTKLEVRAAGNIGTGSTTTEDITPGPPPFFFCGAGSGTFFTEFAEMILVKGTLNDADLGSTVSYLKDKYKL